MEIAQLKRIIEAAIMAANTPQTLVQLNDLFGEEDAPGVSSIHAAIELLQSDYAEHGVALIEVASGWRFQVRTEMQPWVSRLWTERQSKYTRALLETLALIAYRQPVTRAEIEQIRGVAVSSNIIKTLEEREWIRVLGHRDVPGKPALFGTTRQFLDYFGLKSLDQLPALAELRDLSEFEPQLDLDRIAPVAVAGVSPPGADDDNHRNEETDEAPLQADDEVGESDDHVFAVVDLALELDTVQSVDDDSTHEAFETGRVEDNDLLDHDEDEQTPDSVETVFPSDQPAHESIEANVADDADASLAAKETP